MSIPGLITRIDKHRCVQLYIIQGGTSIVDAAGRELDDNCSAIVRLRLRHAFNCPGLGPLTQVQWHPKADREALVARYPRFADVKRVWMAELHPGDTLIIPSSWFHFPEAVTASMSVNTWTTSPEALVWTGSLQRASMAFIDMYAKESTLVRDNI